MLTDLRLGQAPPVHGDRTQRGERRVLEIHAVGHVRHQVLRHEGILGVNGVSAAGAGHAVSHPESLQPVADGDDDTGGRVAEREGLIEAVLDGVERGEQALTAHFVQRLAHEVGP